MKKESIALVLLLAFMLANYASASLKGRHSIYGPVRPIQLTLNYVCLLILACGFITEVIVQQKRDLFIPTLIVLVVQIVLIELTKKKMRE